MDFEENWKQVIGPFNDYFTNTFSFETSEYIFKKITNESHF
jgi:hypothetical protein